MSRALAKSVEQYPAPGPFLQRIHIEHGPPDVLARFFLAAEDAVRSRGVVLEVGTFEDLARTNERHYDSWGRLVTMFDPRVAAIPNENALCLVGRNEGGEIVLTGATRLYDLSGTTFARMVASNKLFYPDSQPPTGERCEVTAVSTEHLTGKLMYSGALWIRPDFRRRQLSPIIARLQRAYAMSLWGAALDVSFAHRKLVENGVADGYGFKHFEQSFRRYIGDRLDFEGSYLWVTDQETILEVERFMANELAGFGLNDAEKERRAI